MVSDRDVRNGDGRGPGDEGSAPLRAGASGSAPSPEEETAARERQAAAQEVVKRHMVLAMGVGLIPAPLWDLAAVGAVQLRMLKQLAELYPHATFSAEAGKSAIAALTGGAGAAFVGMRLVSVLKAMPGLGHLLAGAAIPVTAGASTYAVGRIFMRHFETGGTLLTLNPEKVKHAYKDLYAEGKKKAAEVVSALVR